MRWELSGIYDGAPLGMALFSPKGDYLRANRKLAQYSGVPHADYEGANLRDIVPDIADLMMGKIQEVVETGKPIEGWLLNRKDEGGGERYYAIHWYPVFNEDRSIKAVGAIIEDITEQHRREAMLSHIARELQHRVKNTLANVSALVDQAKRSVETDSDALDTLKSRLQALAKTHSMLTEANWQVTSLRELVEQELIAVHGSEFISISGPDLEIAAQPALAFAMALHELAANAARYGSLSVPGGRLSLQWEIDADDPNGKQVVFTWVEKNRNAIADEEDRCAVVKGFGNRLIDASIRTSLRGRIEREWLKSGLQVRFALPFGLLTGEGRQNL